MEVTPNSFEQPNEHHGESEYSVNEKFLAAVEIVQNMPKDGPITTTTDEKLAFYSLYKQATVGPCNTPQPAFWNVVERFKWDAWNSLGAMDSNEAKAAYVNRLLRKVHAGNNEYAAEDWMKGELYEQMLPKFAVLGARLSSNVRRRKTESSVEEENYEPVGCPETIEEEHSDTRSHTSSPFENATSDVDYVDCVEDGRCSGASRRMGLHNDVAPRSRDRSDSIISQYTHKIEDELMLISQQISNLATSAEHRHSSLKSIFKKATFYMFVPSGISWKTIVILIVWPFVANMLVRIIRNMIGI